MPDYNQLSDPVFDIIKRDNSIEYNSDDHKELDMLKQRYSLRMPRGKFSNMHLLYLFRKVKYLAFNVRNRTRQLITE